MGFEKGKKKWAPPMSILLKLRAQAEPRCGIEADD